MKCSHCGGTLIYHPGNCLEQAVVKCMACGREGMKNMESETKKCSKCCKDLSIESFYKNKTNDDGLEYWCKDCKKSASRAYRDKKAGLEHGPAKRGGRSQKTGSRRQKAPVSRVRRQKQGSSRPLPTITRATPEQIIADLRRGLAIEIIEMIQEKFGL